MIFLTSLFLTACIILNGRASKYPDKYWTQKRYSEPRPMYNDDNVLFRSDTKPYFEELEDVINIDIHNSPKAKIAVLAIDIETPGGLTQEEIESRTQVDLIKEISINNRDWTTNNDDIFSIQVQDDHTLDIIPIKLGSGTITTADGSYAKTITVATAPDIYQWVVVDDNSEATRVVDLLETTYDPITLKVYHPGEVNTTKYKGTITWTCDNNDVILENQENNRSAKVNFNTIISRQC